MRDQHDPRAIRRLILPQLSARFTRRAPTVWSGLDKLLKYIKLICLARNLLWVSWYSDTDPNVIATNNKEEYGMAHRRVYARSKARKGKGLTLATMVLSGWLLAGLSMAISIGFNPPV